MSIRLKAAIETTKLLGLLGVISAGYYMLLEMLGPKIGMLLILVSMIGVFSWSIYDYFYNKFTWQEKYKD
jgi:hypothetical protein